ncbi:hypothetical protein IJT10_01785 [bacterium]|nr:hypothetical protein [bacterium]
MQLVSPHVKVMTMRRGIVDAVIYNEDLVLKKYGLRPSQLASLRALSGDSSQNIGGVPGIGEVTARRLLSQYSSLTELFDSLDQLPAKWRNPLSENCDDAFEYLARATIRFDLPLEIDWEECKFKGFPVQVIERLFKMFSIEGFNSILTYMKRIACEEQPSNLPEEPVQVGEIEFTLQHIAELKSELAIVWMVDGEGNKRGISLCCAGEKPLYISLDPGIEEVVWRYLEPIIADKDRLKYVLGMREIYERALVNVENVLDIRLASSLLFINALDHSIETICARFGFAIFERVLFGWEDCCKAATPTESLLIWSCRASDIMLPLGKMMLKSMQALSLEGIYNNVELPLSLYMYKLNKNGVSFNSSAVENLRVYVEGELLKIHEDFFAEAEVESFDLDSDEAVSNYLFERLALLMPTRPKNGSILNADMLKSLQDQNPIVEKILCYRELSEFKRIFVEKFLSERDFTIKPETYLFNSALLSERRLQLLGKVSVKGVIEIFHYMLAIIANFSYVEVRNSISELVEKVLEPESEGKVLMKFALPSMEWHILAHVSGDQRLKDALGEGRDIGGELVKAVFEDKFGEIYNDEFFVSQMSLFYYSPLWLIRRLNLLSIDKEQVANNYLRKFESILGERFPVSWDFLLKCRSRASAMEQLQTLSGRQCRLVEAGSRNYSVRENAERLAMAFVTEGTCADIFRDIIVASKKLWGEEIELLVINNSLLVYAPREKVEEIESSCLEIIRQSSYGIALPVHCKKN